MHLFIVDWKKSGDSYRVRDERVVKHARNVLRMQKWDEFLLQSFSDSSDRFLIRIEQIEKNEIIGQLIQSYDCDIVRSNLVVCVAMPNKLATLEHICQKLTELWVKEIFVWRAARSQLKDISSNKLARLNKIIIEAWEQSKNRFIPSLKFGKPWDVKCEANQCFLADQWGKTMLDADLWKWEIYLIVGPEWWLTDQDYQNWNVWRDRVYGLWDTILRMETAAIVWSGILRLKE